MSYNSSSRIPPPTRSSLSSSTNSNSNNAMPSSFARPLSRQGSASTSSIGVSGIPRTTGPTSRTMLSAAAASAGGGGYGRKRGASDAGLDENAPLRSSTPLSSSTSRPLIASGSGPNNTGTIIQLENKLKRAKDEQAQLAKTNEEQRMEIARLTDERRRLAEGSSRERAMGEKNEGSWAEERLSTRKEISSLQTQLQNLRDKLEDTTSDRDQAKGELSKLRQDRAREEQTANARIADLAEQVNGLKGWQRRSQALTIELEEQKRRLAEVRQGKDDAEGESKGDEVLRKEWRRQSQQFVVQNKEAQSMKLELTDLRTSKKEAESKERSLRTELREVKEELRNVREQLARSHQDMESLTQPFPSGSSSSTSAEVERLQSQFTTMTQKYNAATKSLSEKELELAQLHARHHETAADAHDTIKELTRRLTEAERNERWAIQGRESAERLEKAARRALELKEHDLNEPSMPGGVSFGNSNDAARATRAEKLAEMYRAELDGMKRDSQEMEERITQGAGLVKQTLLDEANAQVESLKADIEALNLTIAELTKANTTLDAEVTDLMRRVASGEYNPAKERVIEFANNPAAKIKMIRLKEIEQLRKENDALLEELRELEDSKMGSVGLEGATAKEGETSSAAAQRYVPRESWERVVDDLRRQEAAHEKRLQRLKEIFGNKSKEFLEAVYSLLGWRIKFDESGADIRLTSMYAPKGKMGLTLKFASQEGHFGTMQMTGAMAKGLEEARQFWILERQSVPGFLAQVTTECFERTTVGRASGYVGLE